jgi:hypothetical protein
MWNAGSLQGVEMVLHNLTIQLPHALRSSVFFYDDWAVAVTTWWSYFVAVVCCSRIFFDGTPEYHTSTLPSIRTKKNLITKCRNVLLEISAISEGKFSFSSSRGCHILSEEPLRQAQNIF